MKTGRRGFFGLMGGAAFAGPGLIKEVAEESTKAASVSLSDFSLPIVPLSGVDKTTAEPLIPDMFSGPTGRQIFVKQFGIPEFLQRRWECEARKETRLDDDLKANKSMSAAAKIREQRRRLVEREKQQWLYGARESWWDMRDVMEKQFPWIGRL